MHEGHRKRMYERIVENSSMSPHEVVEVLLYNVNPRKDTNPIAHRLIDTFGTLNNLFNASVDELMGIEGVGSEVAYYIKTVGACYNYVRIDQVNELLFSRGDLREYIVKRMKDLENEQLNIYLLGANGELLRCYTYTQNDSYGVRLNGQELARIITLVHPDKVVLAHNHPGETSAPSVADFEFTKRASIVCSILNVLLYDHMIVGNDGVFSFNEKCLIEEIRRKYTFEEVLRRGKNI